MWAMRGAMHPELEAKLASLLQVPPALVEGCHNPLEHEGFKTNGINWDEHRAGREWFWVEDENSEQERDVLRAMHAEHRFIRCHTSKEPDALLATMNLIRARLARATERVR